MSLSIAKFYLLLVFALCSFPLFAQTDSVGLSTGQGLKVLLSLCFVISLIFALLYAIRRIQLVNQNTGLMKMLSAVSVGPKEKVVLIQVGDQQLLIGVAQQSVSLLSKIDPPISASRTSQPNSSSFAAKLNARLQQNKTP